MTEVVTVSRGAGPLVLAQPHGGTWLPEDLRARLNRRGAELADTDWHIGRLYDGLRPDATVVRAHVHRYVIDVNRDPEGRSLYPDRNTTGLCPETDFDGVPIWREGQAPGADEIADRRARYHARYHGALAEELDRVRRAHGVAILYDCHSIRSRIPYLFDGLLPVFSIGTNDGASCDVTVEAAAAETCAAATDYDSVVNGRFKGGWTTRHYGRPAEGLHAIQMELAQRAYMDEAAPWCYRPERAEPLRACLVTLLNRLCDLVRAGVLDMQGPST